MKNPLGRSKGKRGAKNPFASLGKVEKQPTRFAKQTNQGKRMTGSTLLKRAMGKMVQVSGAGSKSGVKNKTGGLVNKK